MPVLPVDRCTSVFRSHDDRPQAGLAGRHSRQDVIVAGVQTRQGGERAPERLGLHVRHDEAVPRPDALDVDAHLRRELVRPAAQLLARQADDGRPGDECDGGAVPPAHGEAAGIETEPEVSDLRRPRHSGKECHVDEIELGDVGEIVGRRQR